MTSDPRNPTPSPLPTLGTDALLAKWDPMLQGMAWRAARGLSNAPALVEDAAQIARVAFAEGCEACPEKIEKLMFGWGRMKARHSLRKWRNSFHTQSRDVYREVSAHTPVGEDGSVLLDLLPAPAEPAAFPPELARAVREAVTTLPKRERVVMELYWFKGVPGTKIALIVGLTQQRIHQIIEKSLATLRFRLPKNLQEQYL